MKKKLLAMLLAVVMAVGLLPGTAWAASANPNDTATEANVLEVLRQYDAGAYHIMATEGDFLSWFAGKSLISGIDTAVHETYHSYTFDQRGAFYGERIYLGSGMIHDVDYSVVYRGGNFTKTEEMSKQIPSRLQTFRYDTYVAPGSTLDANTKSVFGLLNEFTAYYWGLESMNSLAQFLLDTNAGADAWKAYISSIGNNATAYAEFKYWTLRYMLYIKSANPSLYQAILDNEAYCTAYRDAEAKFASEIGRSRENLNRCAQYLSSIGCRVEWSDSGIYLRVNLGNGSYSFSGLDLTDYTTLMAELGAAEYLEMDSILKGAASGGPEAPTVSGFTDVKPTDHFADAVAWAVENGVTSGKSATVFDPGGSCTRGQIVTFLWRAHGKPEPASAVNPFTDVKPNAYYYKAVLWAVENGITSGKTATTFGPGGICTRRDALTFQWRAAGKPAAAGGIPFTDVPSGKYYSTAVAWAAANGIAQGAGAFHPTNVCTRADIVTFLYRELA